MPSDNSQTYNDWSGVADFAGGNIRTIEIVLFTLLLAPT